MIMLVLINLSNVLYNSDGAALLLRCPIVDTLLSLCLFLVKPKVRPGRCRPLDQDNEKG